MGDFSLSESCLVYPLIRHYSRQSVSFTFSETFLHLDLFPLLSISAVSTDEILGACPRSHRPSRTAFSADPGVLSHCLVVSCTDCAWDLVGLDILCLRLLLTYLGLESRKWLIRDERTGPPERSSLVNRG